MDCKNCTSQLTTDSLFCIACGNKVITKRLTVKQVINDFNNQFFNYDNKIFKTFIHLFTKPEVVIEKFISGARKTYVNVISYLAISLTLIGFQFLVLRDRLTETTENPFIPEDEQSIEFQRRMAEIMGNIYDYFGLVTIITIPITALATYIVFLNRKHNYAEHIVINIYTTANYIIIMIVLSSILIVFGVNTQLAFAITTLPIYIYLGYCYKRLYSLSFFGAVWRTIVSQTIYMFFIMIILVVIAILVLVIIKLIY